MTRRASCSGWHWREALRCEYGTAGRERWPGVPGRVTVLDKGNTLLGLPGKSRESSVSRPRTRSREEEAESGWGAGPSPNRLRPRPILGTVGRPGSFLMHQGLLSLPINYGKYV